MKHIKTYIAVIYNAICSCAFFKQVLNMVYHIFDVFFVGLAFFNHWRLRIIFHIL